MCSKSLCGAIKSFTDLFALEDKQKLYSIPSGAAASPQIETDVLRVEAADEEAKESIIIDWLEKHTKFVGPIKRLNLKSLGHLSKTVRDNSTEQGCSV